MRRQAFQQQARPQQDALRHAQKLKRVSGGGHVDQDLAALCLDQVENAENGEEFVHARRNDLQKSGKDFFLESEIDMEAPGLHAQF